MFSNKDSLLEFTDQFCVGKWTDWSFDQTKHDTLHIATSMADAGVMFSLSKELFSTYDIEEINWTGTPEKG